MTQETDVIKILQQMGKWVDQPLTSEQERLLKQAIDPEEQFMVDVENLFAPKKDK